MIRLMEKGSTCIKMVPHIRVNGMKTFSMGLEFRNGQMAQAMRETMIWEKNTTMASLHGQMGQLIQEISKTI